MDGQNFCTVHKIPLKNAIKSHKISEIFRIWRIIRTENFDAVIDFQGLYKSAIFSRAIAKNAVITGLSARCIKESGAAIFYDRKIFIDFSRHVAWRNVVLLFFGANIRTDPDFFIKNAHFSAHKMFVFSREDQIFAQNFLKNLPNFSRQKIVIFVPEASVRAKMYSTQNFIEFGRLIPHTQILILWQKFPKIAQKISQNLPHAHVLPQMNFSQIKAIFSRANLIIGGDTGLVHLAFFMKIPSIMLFGATHKTKNQFVSPKNIALCPQDAQNPKHIHENPVLFWRKIALDPKTLQKITKRDKIIDKNDFSINEIPPALVFLHAQKLLKS